MAIGLPSIVELDNFVSLPWKFDNPYCHILQCYVLSVFLNERISVIWFFFFFLGCPHNKGLSFRLRVRIGPQNCVHLRGHGKTKAQNHLVQGWTRAL